MLNHDISGLNGDLNSSEIFADVQLAECCGAQRVLAANRHRRKPSPLIFDHPDNLRPGETALYHVSAPNSWTHCT
jgi:hypothetical protein